MTGGETSVEDALVVQWLIKLQVKQLFQQSSVSDDVVSWTPRLRTDRRTDIQTLTIT